MHHDRHSFTKKESPTCCVAEGHVPATAEPLYGRLFGEFLTIHSRIHLMEGFVPTVLGNDECFRKPHQHTFRNSPDIGETQD